VPAFENLANFHELPATGIYVVAARYVSLQRYMTIFASEIFWIQERYLAAVFRYFTKDQNTVIEKFDYLSIFITDFNFS
jgi:hypothetical protein